MKEYFKKIYFKTEAEFHNLVEEKLKNNEKAFIVTANPETLMIAEENQKFKNILLDGHTTITPDGIGVVKGAQILGYETNGTITGVELSVKLMEFCNKYKKDLCLFGAEKEVVEKLVEKIKKEYPNINLVGVFDGYVKDKQEVFEKIKKLKPDVTLVALGIPAQEILIHDNLKDFEKGIFVGVGGSFDVISGMKKRAPKMFIKLHLEWLYRITKEPKRLKRFFNSNVRYISKIYKEK